MNLDTKMRWEFFFFPFFLSLTKEIIFIYRYCGIPSFFITTSFSFNRMFHDGILEKVVFHFWKGRSYLEREMMNYEFCVLYLVKVSKCGHQSIIIDRTEGRDTSNFYHGRQWFGLEVSRPWLDIFFFFLFIFA